MSNGDSNLTRHQLHFLLLLLAADALFILIHVVNQSTELLGQRRIMDLDRDTGYAEVFQYIKLYWAVILLALLWLRTRTFVFFAWTAVFGYLLLDDALQIHELGGEFVADAWNYQPLLGLRDVDFGELTITAIAGVVLLGLLAIGYTRSGPDGRDASKDFAVLIAALALFGVGFDMVHQMVGETVLDPLFVVAEDGGEMIVISFVCWYAARLLLAGGQVQSPLRRILVQSGASSGNRRASAAIAPRPSP